ncbi:hypothetical protein K8Z61_15205 [Nocardioides sp. TRM66260-LWL]|uniref:BTAD domain-containing putative transcriptional regulator n=1 Tax=Nocardioides sp. TRM66260-LWL TaxID=2874478 RepID=UPI001CC7C9A1|nr:BTAD domain-containing putative transcriptional regulator [Nocardioides sp. TRM66260-LWL]MBZ5735840.1 hypothetical protein [Nocardioides sp. TRM66260-LWL]
MTLAVVPGYAAISAALVTSVLGELDRADVWERRGTDLVARLLADDWARLEGAVAAAAADPAAPLPAAFAWRCAYGLHHLGELQRARAVAARGAVDPSASRPDRARVAALRAALAWTAGDEGRCREHAAEARTLAGDHPGAGAFSWVAQALLAAISGDRDANAHAYERGLACARAAGDRISEERILNNLGSAAIEEGRYADAADLLAAGLEVNDLTGHHSGLAVLRHNLAEAMLGRGRLDEALLEVEAARTLWTAIGSPSAGAAWQVLGEVQAARGNATQASLAYREALRLAEEQDDAQTAVPALAGLARVAAADDPDEADALVCRLLAATGSVGDANQHLAAGWVRLQRGAAEAARGHAAQAVEAAGRHRDLPRLAEALLLSALAAEQPDDDDPRVREARDIGERLDAPLIAAQAELVRAGLGRDRLALDLALERLQMLGVHDDAARIAGPAQAVRARRPAPAIRVHALGRLSVHRDGEPVPASAWPSRKAREVLAVLAGRGEHGIARGALGTLLWPEVADVGPRLSVALSHLRSTLDPERRHAADHYLRADREHVALDLEHVAVDVVDFEQAARAALRAHRLDAPDALRLLEAAAARHTGELLEDDAVEEWALELRDRIEELGRRVVEALAERHGRGADPAAAVPWLARLLAMDPYDEPTYRAVVTTLRRLGRYGESRRFHRTYALRMAELDVPARSWEELSGAAGDPGLTAVTGGRG